MSINLLDSFNYKGKRPDFVRQQFGTIAAMKAFSDNYLPDMYLAFCLEDGKVYIYNRNNAVDETTGRWRELEGGGGGGGDLTNYYTKSETNALLENKQDELQYDSVPTYGSTNVMTSGGIYNALTSKQNTLVFDNMPRAGSYNPVASYGIYNEFQTVATRDERQQEQLDFLANRTVKNLVVPTTLNKTMCGVTFTVGSDNKVTISGGVTDPNTFACITLVGATQSQTNTYENQVPIPKGTYKVVCLGGSESTYYVELGFRNVSSGARQTRTVYDGSADFSITTDNGRYDLVLYCVSKTAGYTATVAPMVCLMWFDNTYAPYAPTNKELYEMVKTKQGTLTFDTAPTSASTNPVTSGGVYTALSQKINGSQAVGALLGTGSYSQIQPNTNLDTKTTYGIFACTDSSTLLNCPVSSDGTPFRLYVLTLEGNSKMQILLPADGTERIYTRVYTNSIWSAWNKQATTDDIAAAVANKITNDDVFGQGTRIQGTDDVHANMDNYWAQGNYYIATADNLGYIDNKPPNVLNARAKILVFQFSGTLETNNRCVQIWIPQRLPTTSVESPACFYMRYRTTSTQGEVSWTSWFMLSDGVMTAFGVANATILTGTTFNCDTATTPGVYIAGNTTTAEAAPGRPAYDSSAAKIWRLEVKSLNSSRVYQEMTVFKVGTYEGDFDRYTRMKKSGTNNEWWSWKHIETTDVQTYYPTT